MPKPEVTKDLVPLQPLQVEGIFKNGKTRNEILAKIKDYALNTTFDITTVKGRKACIKHAADVKRSIKAVAEKALSLTNRHKDAVQEINDIRNKVQNFLKPIADEVRAPVSAWEEQDKRKKEKEANRVEAIRERIDAITCHKPRNDKDVPIPPDQATAKQLSAAVAFLSDMTLDEGFYQECLDEAKESRSKRADELLSILDFRQEQDKLAADKETLRKKEQEVEDEKRRLADEKREQEELAEAQEVLRKTNLSSLVKRIAFFRYHSEVWEDAPRIEKMIASLEKIVIDGSYQERENEAKELKDRILTHLREGLPIAVKADEAKAEKDKKETEEKIEKEVAAKRKKEEDAAAVRRANTEHRRQVNREVIALIQSVEISEEKAIDILKAIIKSKSKFITINY